MTAACIWASTAPVVWQAKGWTIVRRKISANGRTKIAIYLVTYTFVQLMSIFW